MDIENFYSKRARFYDLITRVLGHDRSIRKFFKSRNYLRPGMKILDAGCGTGAVTRVLIEIAAESQIGNLQFFGFDLTERMLRIFRERIDYKKTQVKLCKADVLDLKNQLPADWKNFDFIVSCGMLEYIPSDRFVETLVGLKRLLKPSGKLIIFISRKNLAGRLIIERFWKAKLFEKDEIRSAIEAAGFKTPNIMKKFRTWGYVVEAES